MPELPSIINMGELSKPATVLVEKISDAIGGIFRPTQIRRIAQAEADADRISAISQIEINDLKLRALQRFVVEEANKQHNIEQITRKALPEVSEQAVPQNLENDWIANFFDKSRLISDDEMQNLWAKVLAGEANTPGKYSKRTVNLLAGLDKSDAEMFAKLCSFAFDIGELTLLIYETGHKIYIDHGVSFSTISHLASIGLIHFENLGGYQRTGLGPEGFVSYFGTQVWIGFGKPENNELQTGHVLLTQAGRQLAPISGAKPTEGFVQYVREKWKGFGYKVDKDPVVITFQSAGSPSQGWFH